jgi:hypothetical protein
MHYKKEREIKSETLFNQHSLNNDIYIICLLENVDTKISEIKNDISYLLHLNSIKFSNLMKIIDIFIILVKMNIID